MHGSISDAVQLLRGIGVRCEAGLTDAELARIESRYAFEFCASHREFLSAALPLSPIDEPARWPDWRNGSEEHLRGRLAWPVDSVVFDVLHHVFWPVSWGERPIADADAEALAREHLGRVPTMVPIFVHRYLEAAPAVDPPVYSIYQTDVIVYGENLIDYLAEEFGGGRSSTPRAGVVGRTPFWSDLADGDD